MFFIILVSHDNTPTLFGPYCSFKSALDVVQGPCFRVPINTLQAPGETYFIQEHDTDCSVTITELTREDKLGCIPL